MIGAGVGRFGRSGVQVTRLQRVAPWAGRRRAPEDIDGGAVAEARPGFPARRAAASFQRFNP